MGGLLRGVVGAVEQREDHKQNHGDHQLQPLARTDLVLILAAPLNEVARRHLYLLVHGALGLIDEAAHISASHIQKHSPA